ncbi:MAG: hypothetical protein RLZZ387_3345 [Chloroflexota bacterium]
MTFESALSLVTSTFWMAPLLLVPAVLTLEAERRWTRARRRAGRPASVLAYLLDALVVVTALAASVGTLLFVIGTAVLAGRWGVSALGELVESLMRNPLLLIVLALAAVGALTGVAVVRGWIRLPRRSTAEPSGRAALPAGAPAAGSPVTREVPRPATLFLAALAEPPASPPSAPRQPPATPPQVAPRTSPALAMAASPASHARSAGSAAAAPSTAPVEEDALTGLAMLRNRRRLVGESQPAPQVAVVVSQATVPEEEDELPTLAMLNNRRRGMNDHLAEAKTAPVSAPVIAPLPPPARSRPWWRLPLAVTTVLVVALAAALIFAREPLVASVGELSGQLGLAIPNMDQAFAAGQGAVDGREAPPQPAPTIAPEPAAAQPATAQVSADALNVRASPGTNQPVLATLTRGETVELLGEERAIRDSIWVKVRAGGVEGWVSRAFLQ